MLRRRAGLRQELLLPGQLDDLRAALRLASAPSRVRAQVLARLCWALMREDRYEESERLARDLLALAGQLGDGEHQAEAVMALAALGAHRGEDTVAALRGAREAAARAGSGLLEAWAYLTITDVLEGRGRHELAIQAGREGLARARQLGLARQIAAPIAGNLAESLTSAGRWDEALEILDEVLGLDLPPLGRFAPLLGRGQIAIARGDLEAASRTLHELRSLPRRARSTCREKPATRRGSGRIWSCAPAASRGWGRCTMPGRRPSPPNPPAPTAARTWPAGMPPLRPGKPWLSPIRRHTHCCAPRAPRRRPGTGTAPPAGSGVRQSWPAGSAPARCSSRSGGEAAAIAHRRHLLDDL